MLEKSEIDNIKRAYSTDDVSNGYIEKRFITPIGRLLHEKQVDFVINIINNHKFNNILEIAPGPARLTVDIGTKCNGVKGTIVDVNANMIRLAQKKLNKAGLLGSWRVVLGDAFALPLSDKFQLIYTFRFIRHFRRDDRSRIYSQIYRSLDKNGLLVLDAVNYYVSYPLRKKHGKYQYPIYDKLYKYNDFDQELRENGFNILECARVQTNYRLQSLIQKWISPRSDKLAYFLLKIIETAKLGQPLEWIVLCQKI